MPVPERDNTSRAWRQVELLIKCSLTLTVPSLLEGLYIYTLRLTDSTLGFMDIGEARIVNELGMRLVVQFLDAKNKSSPKM